MIRELLNSLSFWHVILLFMLVLFFTAYLSALISTYINPTPIDNDRRELANSLVSILGTGFSILLAFAIINTWNYLLIARATTIKEADNLALLIRNTAVFPPAIKDKITKATRDYTTSVRVDEWKSMRNGQESPKAWQALDNLYATIASYDPQTAQEKFYYSQLISHTNDLLINRRTRLNEIDSIIPPPLRGALIAGAFLLAGILGAVRGENNIFNILPALFFCIVLGFNLALAINFDYPFSGDISLSNKIYYSGVLSEFSD